ncbi:hypothetical protein O6H91_07G057300 [Diphasiastrum complanatum]|uniref:Uncharacterized protein n=1 Tax=Diphasiastrum complanatum TaxID=34168 RepID=A0ACC2D5G0_DIPCM|nr:hypothetical protein O6H91_07G057300 [Diphasiastrum complanatum]
MAVRAKSTRVLKAEDETKAALDVIFVSKSAELQGKKNKDIEFQNGHIQKGVDLSQLQNASMENNMAARRINIDRRVVELGPSTSKGSKKVTKMYKTGDARGRAGALVSSSSSTVQILSQNQSKPTLKNPFTQLLSKNQAKAVESSRMLVTVNVSGSTGPLRFLVDVKDPVSRVIELALRAYAREGRLPHLGFNCSLVELLSTNSNFEALDPAQPVGSLGTRHFLLYRRRNEESEHVAKKTECVGPMRWKFMWNMMNSIVCSH